MKSRFQKKNIRKSRRQSLRRKIQRGGQEINCNSYPWPRTCPPPCKRLHLACYTEEQYNAALIAAERNQRQYEAILGPSKPKPGPLDRLMRQA